MNGETKTEQQNDHTFEQLCKKEIKHEWQAIEGTYKALQQRCSDPIVLERVETIIRHAKELGKWEVALKRMVAP